MLRSPFVAIVLLQRLYVTAASPSLRKVRSAEVGAKQDGFDQPERGTQRDAVTRGVDEPALPRGPSPL